VRPCSRSRNGSLESRACAARRREFLEEAPVARVAGAVAAGAPPIAKASAPGSAVTGAVATLAPPLFGNWPKWTAIAFCDGLKCASCARKGAIAWAVPAGRTLWAVWLAPAASPVSASTKAWVRQAARS
jgi:hypothetical protein